MDLNNQAISFIPRLYSMVNDPAIPQISWSKTGEFFVIPNPEEFAQLVLPAQFKHNNFASFVRQLNMYGFHKVADLSQLANSGNPRAWAFEHPGFVKNKPELLQNIHRKPKSSTLKKQQLQQQQHLQQKIATEQKVVLPLKEIPSSEQQKKAGLLIEEIIKTKQQQQQIGQQVRKIEAEREMLWKEYAQTQKKLYEQQEVTKQVLKFLAAVAKQQQLPGFSAPAAAPVANRVPLTRRLTDYSQTEEPESGEPAIKAEAMDVDSRPSSPVSEPDLSSFVEDLGDDAAFEPPSMTDSDLASFLHSNSSATTAPSADTDFVSELYQFEDAHITPYCSMEEDLVRYGLNAPLNWVPS